MDWTEPTDEDKNFKPTAKGTEEMKVQKITGTLYPCVSGTKDMVEQMGIVRGLKLRDDDVLTIGLQRSGNHWCFEIVNMVLNQQLEYQKDHFLHHLLEYIGPDVQTKIDDFESPRNLTMHTRVTKIPLEALEKKTKIIYVMRNPKDVWVSSYVCYTTILSPDVKFTGTFDEYFQCQVDNTFINGSWFDHVWATEKFMEDHPDHPVFVLSYELMKQDPKKVLKELCQFLGRPDTLVDAIAEATAIAKMKPALQQGKMAAFAGLIMPKEKNELIRNGVVGDWQKWFTVHQNKVFDQLFKEKMKGSKLASRVKPFMEV